LISIAERFHAADLLNSLCIDVGDSEFGYRVQGLLAHTLLRMGGIVFEIKPQGHPDITVQLGSRRLIIQVKSTHSQSTRQNFVLPSDDYNGIRPVNKDEIGYLAILECVPPITWILVQSNRLDNLLSRPMRLVELRAMADKKFSQECTDEFVSLIIDNQAQLRDLNFRILSIRAIKGDPF